MTRGEPLVDRLRNADCTNDGAGNCSCDLLGQAADTISAQTQTITDQAVEIEQLAEIAAARLDALSIVEDNIKFAHEQNSALISSNQALRTALERIAAKGAVYESDYRLGLDPQSIARAALSAARSVNT